MVDWIVTPAILAVNAAVGLVHDQAGEAVKSVVSGVIGNRADAWLGLGAKRVARLMSEGTREENHHLLRAAHTAYVAAMRDMADMCDEYATSAEEREAAMEFKNLVAEKRFAGFRYDGEHFPLAEANAAIDRMFGSAVGVLDGGGSGDEQQPWGRTAVSDLLAWGVVLPDDLARLFWEGGAGLGGWASRYRAQFSKALIDDEAARTVFTAERLGELRRNGIELIDAVGRIEAKMEAGFAANSARFDQLEALLGEVLARRGDEINRAAISETAIVRIARKVNDNVADPGQAIAEIERAIDDLLQLRADAARGSNLDALVAEALRRIDERAAAGEFDAAAGEAERAFAEWDRREVDRRERERAVGLRFVEENIRINRLRRDVEDIAKWEWRRIELSVSGEDMRMVFLVKTLNLLIDSGTDIGINLDLEVAEALARNREQHEADDRRRSGLLMCRAEVLSRLGERQEGINALEKASEIQKLLLNIHTREKDYLAWASIQLNLGNVLQAIGWRLDGVEYLESAVLAYTAAISVYKEHNLYEDLADANNNLGNALASIYERTGDTDTLNDAINASKQSLAIWGIGTFSSKWAIAQGNLGGMLRKLGAHEEGTSALEASIAAYNAALTVHTRKQFAIKWALVQNNLGNAYASLAEKSGSIDGFDDALAALQAALTVRTREQQPIAWATTQKNTGLALLSKASRTRAGMDARESVLAFEAALEVYGQPGHDYERAIVERGLAVARALVAELCP